MNKLDLISVFENTKYIINSGKINSNSITTKHTVSEIGFKINPFYTPTIQTINSDTVTTSDSYSKLGKTCVLNMASAKRAGGGVANGEIAQEECLFRCSNLFETVNQDFYPLAIDEALYTKDAVFFKDKDYNIIEPFVVDVITIPALNLNSNAKYDNIDLIADYHEIMKNKIRLIFHLANKNGCTNIILGAWGCGVFKNNPINVATLFNEVIFEKKTLIDMSYFDCFENIIFAIINDHNSIDNNFEIFLKILG